MPLLPTYASHASKAINFSPKQHQPPTINVLPAANPVPHATQMELVQPVSPPINLNQQLEPASCAMIQDVPLAPTMEIPAVLLVPLDGLNPMEPAPSVSPDAPTAPVLLYVPHAQSTSITYRMIHAHSAPMHFAARPVLSIQPPT